MGLSDVASEGLCTVLSRCKNVVLISVKRCEQRRDSVSVFVSTAERKTSLGKDWHSACLRCEKCNKTLTPGSHAEHDGKPYCHQPCYSALFGPGGQHNILLSGLLFPSDFPTHLAYVLHTYVTRLIPHDLSSIIRLGEEYKCTSSCKMSGRCCSRML